MNEIIQTELNDESKLIADSHELLALWKSQIPDSTPTPPLEFFYTLRGTHNFDTIKHAIAETAQKKSRMQSQGMAFSGDYAQRFVWKTANSRARFLQAVAAHASLNKAA